MSTKLMRFAFLLALAGLVAACGKNEEQAANKAAVPAAPVAVPTATPDAAILTAVRMLRANDINGLLTAALPAAQLAKIKTDWTQHLTKDPITDEDRRKFADQMTRLTAPGAEDKIYADIEPQLKKFDKEGAAQMPMMIAMGQGFVQSSIQQSKDLSDEQKKQSAALVDATAKWAQGVKFTDPALVKGAIAAICKTARDLNLKSLNEVRALSYDQGMLKAGIALGGLKQVLAVYGLSLDKSLDSIKVETVSTTGDAAKVKVTYSAFDQPFTTESDLLKVDGKWYGKQAIERWQKEQAQAAATAANPPATPPAPAAK
ncbi:MAG TPA: hypothetical protein VIE67_04885 [Rudaea sp.]|jgi:hypothetical protein|uniref:hypothetical protein n=1 Tax=Rudaea sp. TaxID=2136325 RepID=UPI002F93E1D7